MSFKEKVLGNGSKSFHDWLIDYKEQKKNNNTCFRNQLDPMVFLAQQKGDKYNLFLRKADIANREVKLLVLAGEERERLLKIRNIVDNIEGLKAENYEKLDPNVQLEIIKDILIRRNHLSDIILLWNKALILHICKRVHSLGLHEIKTLPKQLRQSIARLPGNVKVLIKHNEVFESNKILLSTSSTFFYTMLTGPFKEAKTNVIKLPVNNSTWNFINTVVSGYEPTYEDEDINRLLTIYYELKTYVSIDRQEESILCQEWNKLLQQIVLIMNKKLSAKSGECLCKWNVLLHDMREVFTVFLSQYSFTIEEGVTIRVENGLWTLELSKIPTQPISKELLSRLDCLILDSVDLSQFDQDLIVDHLKILRIESSSIDRFKLPSKLKELVIKNTRINEIIPHKGDSELMHVKLVNIKTIKELNWLGNVSRLTKLYCINCCNLTNINQVSLYARNLKELSVKGCKNLIDFRPIILFPDLQLLDIGHTDKHDSVIITDILNRLPALKKIGLAGYSVDNLRPHLSPDIEIL